MRRRPWKISTNSMPNISPAIRPGFHVPSFSKNLTPRSVPMMKSTGSAPIERIIAWSIGGMSGSTSFTAIWLNPQVRHSISIRAMAPALRGRPADGMA
ncbi:hypothetical protein ACVI1J_004391 [Bradyrhizobium diazoefficiens]